MFLTINTFFIFLSIQNKNAYQESSNLKAIKEDISLAITPLLNFVRSTRYYRWQF